MIEACNLYDHVAHCTHSALIEAHEMPIMSIAMAILNSCENILFYMLMGRFVVCDIRFASVNWAFWLDFCVVRGHLCVPISKLFRIFAEELHSFPQLFVFLSVNVTLKTRGKKTKNQPNDIINHNDFGASCVWLCENVRVRDGGTRMWNGHRFDNKSH